MKKLILLTIICAVATLAQAKKVKYRGFQGRPDATVNMDEMKSQYSKNQVQWDAMFRWLASHDLTTIPKGKYPIEGTTLVVSVEDSQNQPLEKRNTESHRRKIDFQYVVRGTERFALLDHETSTISQPYDEVKDVQRYSYDVSKTTFFDNTPGRFLLFFPGDWHIAKICNDTDNQDIRVIVVKIDYVE